MGFSFLGAERLPNSAPSSDRLLQNRRRPSLTEKQGRPVMESPFDIAADLDTPVSAYMKLGPFKPRFLLESVESGERLARYSFIGLGEALTLELYPDRLKIDGKAEKRPASAAEWLALMRRALEHAPLLKPQ